jgi:imidazolonepropionase-like amidohydrolase
VVGAFFASDWGIRLRRAIGVWSLVLVCVWAAGCGYSTPALPSPIATPFLLAETPETAPIVLAGTLIDGTGAGPVADAVLVIWGKVIVDVGPRDTVSLPDGAQVIELEGATMLPGLINAHVHNAYDRRNLEKWARAGVTTVRDLGAPTGEPYFATRDRLRADPRYSRVVAAGPIMTVPEGYPIAGNNLPSLTVTSPEDAKEKIDGLIDDGAEVIKIAIASDAGPILSPQEAAAIVEAAHARGIPVSVHATELVDLKRALAAGVDDVNHMAVDHVPNQVIRQMVDAGVSWVPTFDALGGRGLDNLRRFIRAGGRVALGNDAGYLRGLEIGMPMEEIAWMDKAGMTPMQIIVAATRDAAYVCRLDDEVGTLEVGKVADLMVVEGNPLQDLNALRNARMVVREGVVICGGNSGLACE